MANIFDLYRNLFGGEQPQQGPAQSYDVGADTIPLSLDRTPVDDPYTGTALHQLMGKLGDIGTAVPGLVERAQLGGMNALGMRQADGDIYRAKLPVAPGIEALGDAVNFATGGLQSSLSPAAGAYREAAHYAAREAPRVAGGVLADEYGGIRAFHGSPHSFDRFDLGKIGTGEGAQAYGHGLYFAENEGVARGYRDALAKPDVINDPVGHVWDLLYNRNASRPELLERLDTARHTAFDPARRKFWEDSIKAIESGAVDRYKPPGHMYEVDINADPKAFLDWDRPLSRQGSGALSSLEPLGYKPDRAGVTAFDDALLAALDGTGPASLPKQPADLSGEAIYRALGHERLREAGIPGIRYLDQGSRNAAGWHITPPNATVSGKWMVKSNDYNSKGMHFDNEGEAQAALAEKIGGQTSNYAIFDPSIIEIRRKYGLLPPLAGGGLLATQQEQQ